MQNDPLARSSDKPDLSQLIKEYNGCSPASASASAEWLESVRFCTWPGQHQDGRKHGGEDSPAFPWEGAADGRPFLAERVIGETVALLTTSFWRANARPKSSSSDIGSYAVALVDHFVSSVLYEDLVREVERSAQYQETYGWFVLHPTWEQIVSLRRTPIRIEQLLSFAVQSAQALGWDDALTVNFQSVLLDEAQEDLALSLIGQLWDFYLATTLPEELRSHAQPIKANAWKRALRELRNTGKTEMAIPYLCKNGPAVAALQPYREVFLPGNVADIRSARIIFQREWLSEAELRARTRTHGYDEGWVHEALKHRGEVTVAALPQGDGGSLNRLLTSTHAIRTPTPDESGLVEVVHAFYRTVDDDNIPGIYCTTFHPSVESNGRGEPVYGRHELLNYPHGEYPFVAGAREYHCRSFTSARGVPELVATRQQQKKALQDAVVDRTSITTIPPVNVYQAPMGTRYRFGPAVQNTVLPGKEPAFMAMPNSGGLNEAVVAQERIDFEVDNAFGLLSETVPAQRAQNYQTRTVGNFLLTWSCCFQQLVSLAQRWMPDSEFSQITGAPEGWLEANREALGVLGAQLHFDVRELDPDLAKGRLEAMNQVVLPTDVSGVIDRTKWVSIQLRMINPSWGKELIQSQASASQKLFNSVKDDLAQMFLGNASQPVENDPTAGEKMKYATQIIQANPNYQQALQSNPRFANLVQEWWKNMSFSVTQQKNAQIGKIGVDPEATQ